MRLGDLSTGFVQNLADAVCSFGHDPAPLLEQYGLHATWLAEPAGRLSIPRYMRLGHAAIQLTGQPALGLRMGRVSRISQTGLAGVTAAQAPDVREAARTLIRFEALYGSNYRGQSSLHEDAKAPGCASIPSALTTAITALSWTRFSPAGYSSCPT
jgi:hypothetical protein